MAAPTNAVRLGAAAAGLVYAVALRASGVRLELGLRQILAYLPTVVVLFTVAFDKWIWRWPGIRRVVPRPLLTGLWKATLKPTAESHIPDGGDRGPIEAYVVVNQSFWSLSVRLYTVQSRSDSRGMVLTRYDDSDYQRLSFMYENQPRPEHLHRSPRHVGTCELEVAGKTPTQMSGTYYTDRLTTGEIKLEFCDRSSNPDSFDAARTRCGRPG